MRLVVDFGHLPHCSLPPPPSLSLSFLARAVFCAALLFVAAVVVPAFVSDGRDLKKPKAADEEKDDAPCVELAEAGAASAL